MKYKTILFCHVLLFLILYLQFSFSLSCIYENIMLHLNTMEQLLPLNDDSFGNIYVTEVTCTLIRISSNLAH